MMWVLIIIGSIILLVYLVDHQAHVRQKDKAKEKLSKIHLPKITYQYSGWVSLYVFCGWISCVGGIIILFGGLASDHKDSNSEAFIYFCSALLASLSCFFAAHVLRLQEKTAHHAEKNSELLKIIVDQTKKIEGE